MAHTATALHVLPTLRQLAILIAGLVMTAALGYLMAGAAQESVTAASAFCWRPFLGPFHAVVLHFPIGFLTIAFLLETYRAFRPSDELRSVTIWVLWLSLVTGMISVAFGLMRASGEGYDPHTLQLHKIFGIAVPAATALTLLLEWRAQRNRRQRYPLHTYRVMLTGTLALVVVAGHYGGNLTHGSKYLVENAPQFLKALLDEGGPPGFESDGGGGSMPNDAQAAFYTDKVKPVLATKCTNCHGPEKQKGGYRLDQMDIAFKGGKSGHVAIKPGDPLESNLIRVVLLPTSNDDAMPPEGKQPLKSEEIMALIDWVRQGAVFPQSALPPSALHPGPNQPFETFMESRIHGEFEGWTGATTFRLVNGQVWQQIDGTHADYDAFRPKVMIHQEGPAYRMKVDGVEKAVAVKRLR